MAKVDWKLSDKVMPADMNQIGTEINQLRDDVNNIEIPDGSTTQKGIVQSSNNTTGTSQTLVATEKAVNDARQAAITAAATDASTKASAAEANAKTYADTIVQQSDLWGAL